MGVIFACKVSVGTEMIGLVTEAIQGEVGGNGQAGIEEVRVNGINFLGLCFRIVGGAICSPDQFQVLN